MAHGRQRSALDDVEAGLLAALEREHHTFLPAHAFGRGDVVERAHVEADELDRRLAVLRRVALEDRRAELHDAVGRVQEALDRDRRVGGPLDQLLVEPDGTTRTIAPPRTGEPANDFTSGDVARITLWDA